MEIDLERDIRGVEVAPHDPQGRRARLRTQRVRQFTTAWGLQFMALKIVRRQIDQATTSLRCLSEARSPRIGMQR